MDNVINSRNYITVSELNSDIKKCLEISFSNISVKGEISNLYCHNNRHLYFDLKDKDSKIKVVMFYEAKKDLKFEIRDGLHVIIYGDVSAYEKRGEYQIIASRAEPVGEGSLALAFKQLYEKLEKKGYFEEKYKKEIPALPGIIGVVTSKGGAVIRDIKTVLSKRFENFHLLVRNVNVQGLNSGSEVCDAIDDLSEFGVDVIILARGGGSLEDLWAFNSEEVAEKVFKCHIPVISAIGHETDITICDFVADRRAATPSVAAQMVICNKIDAVNRINDLLNRLKSNLKKNLEKSRQELKFFADRKIFKKPQSLLQDLWQDYDSVKKKMTDATLLKIQNKKAAFDSARLLLSKKPLISRISFNKMSIDNDLYRLFSGEKNKIESLKNRISILLKDVDSKSPVSILKKGFAMVFKKDNDEAVKSINDAGVDEQLRILLKDGILLSKVLEKITKNPGMVN